ncbi:MAG: helix-turn-helix transcriptional regulator [Dehalococcoidia bacterium]
MQSTRQEILHYLRRRGGASVRELGQLLGLTSTGIRQHLTVLERDGLVQAHEERGRVGRPTLVYSLTEKADDLFPKSYDVLANLLIEEIRALDGSERLYQLLHRVAQRMAERHAERLKDKPLPERVAEAVSIMQEQGCLTEYQQQDDEFLINEYACPYHNVSRSHSAMCALDVDFVRILTQADTRLTRSLLRGDLACTYRIRPVDKAAPKTSA